MFDAASDRYRSLFDRYPDAVIVMAPNGSILDVNPAAIDFFGCSRSVLYRSRLSDFLASIDDLERLLHTVAGDGQVTDEPVLFVDRHDQVKHCRVTMIPHAGPDGDIHDYQCVIRDVTMQRQAERKRQSQKQFADQLIDIAPEAIVILDFEDRALRVNEEFCRLFQYSGEQCIGRRMESLIVPETLRAESLSFSARAMNGDCFEAETQRMRKDGSLVDVSILAKPISTADDEPAVYVIYRDISKRKSAEAALKQSEARHRTVLEAAPDPVIVRDMENRVIYFNPAFARIFGWNLDDCLGKPIDFIPEKALPETRQSMARIEKGLGFSGTETFRYTRDGELVAVSISGAVFFDANGTPEGYINTLQDITERRKKDEALRYVAYHDTLTGLPNRKSFYMCLDDLLQHSGRRRSDRTWALMFLDLDKFKQVNDTLGHDTGDLLLKTVATRLRACLRETDHLFRLGGDEFTIILTDLGRDIDVARVAGKLISTVAEVFYLNGHEIFTSTSIGISVFPNDGWEVEGLVKNADMAMYAAKESGGGQYRFFTEEMNQNALYRMKMETHLRKALARDELRIHYQPVVDMAERIVGVEALLRWHHPDLGIILPADFIHIGEDTGVIVSVGQWVLKTACSQVKRWNDKGLGPLFVAVNISARQLQETDFEDIVGRVVEACGLPASSLTLEVTESGVMQNPERCIVKMKHLRARGVNFSIDDFGTGYSSLSYLKRFPIDALKIDRSFVADVMKSSGDREIIRAIISMTRNLNIEAVAEGVETQQQRDFLARAGCDKMQGYLFAEPLTGEQMEHLLETHPAAAGAAVKATKANAGRASS
jgi:diguanylate cyclase (GGDEF)-like protein/PAS domain S-box-containing protein